MSTDRSKFRLLFKTQVYVVYMYKVEADPNPGERQANTHAIVLVEGANQATKLFGPA